MAEKLLMQASEALAEAAIRAGCRFYAGYVITPSTEILEYCATRMPEVGGVCMIPESELAAVNMVYGAAAAGVRAMIGSTSTGISLMQETFAEMANANLPCVAVNLSRGALQGDYFQATRGGGHSDYRFIVLAPESAQETVDLTVLAFYLADKYRNPVMILGDHVLAHASETVEIKLLDESDLPPKTWAATGAQGRPPLIVRWGASGFDRDFDRAQKEKYALISERETRSETRYTEDCDLLVVAYGSAARYTKPAIEQARQEGLRVGLVRPISLWPFPYETVAQAADKASTVLTVELNSGQMVDDVKIAVAGRAPVYQWGSMADMRATYFTGFGTIFTVEDVLEEIRRVASSSREVARR